MVPLHYSLMESVVPVVKKEWKVFHLSLPYGIVRKNELVSHQQWWRLKRLTVADAVSIKKPQGCCRQYITMSLFLTLAIWLA